MQSSAQNVGVEIILMDLGPNLGAINRASLISSDFVVRAADGALGGHATAALDIYKDYKRLALQIADRCAIRLPLFSRDISTDGAFRLFEKCRLGPLAARSPD